MKPFDYLIVGAGLFGAVFAHQARQAGKRCLVIDRRNHLGGNVFCDRIEGINVHRYGAQSLTVTPIVLWHVMAMSCTTCHST